jgi:hypothetical protein
MRGYSFLRLIFKKIDPRSYGYFPKFPHFFFEKIKFSNYVQNCQILLEKHKKF